MAKRPSCALFNCSKSLPSRKCIDCGFVTIEKRTFEVHLCGIDQRKKAGIYRRCKRCHFRSASFVWSWLHKKNCGIRIKKQVLRNKINASCRKKWHDCGKQIMIESETVKCDETVDQTNAEEHILSKHTPSEVVKWYRCHLCEYISKRSTTLKMHIDRVHSEKKSKFKCDQCTYATHFKINLKKHILHVHMENRVYNCKMCDYKAIYKSALKQHMQETHCILIGNKYSCDQCLYTSDKKIQIEAHKMYQHLPKEAIVWNECDQCDYKSYYRPYLKAHIKRMHSASDATKREFLCDECSFVTKSAFSLKKHKICRHLPSTEINWFYCTICDYKSKTNSTLQKHIRFLHLNASRKFKCDQCAFSSPLKINLTQHNLEEHCVGEWRKCDECNFASSIKFELDRHARAVHGVEEFKCSYCKYSAATMNSVKGHVRRMHSKKTLDKANA